MSSRDEHLAAMLIESGPNFLKSLAHYYSADNDSEGSELGD